MLSKINRIKDKKKFPAILKSGSKFFCPYFLLLVELSHSLKSVTSENIGQKNPDPYIEFGFITSKKVGGAVVRNHIRRILSEVVIKEIPLLKPNTRAILIAHNRINSTTFEDLQKEVQKVFTQAKIYKE